MKKSIYCMIAVYVLYIVTLVLAIVFMVLSSELLSSFNDYIDIKSKILFKIKGDETIVSPFVEDGIIVLGLFVGLTVVDLGVYIYQNHFHKKFLKIVNILQTMQFLIFTMIVIFYSTWASVNSSQYTPYIQDRQFCDGFNFLVTKLPQKTMCNFVSEWIYFLKLVFPYTLSFVLVYCIFLSLLFRSQKYIKIESEQTHKDDNIILAESANISEKFIKSYG